MAAKKITSKTTKKTPAKAATKTSKPEEKEVVEETQAQQIETPQSETSRRRFIPPVTRMQVIVLISALIVIGLLWYFKGLFVVATINGQPISRLSYINEMEKQAGQQTLNALVTKTLIMQEAKKRNITVTQEEIDAEVKEVEENVSQQGQNLDQLLAAQNMTREELREQLEIQKTVEKMFAEETKVTDQEVNEYIEENQSSFPEGATSEARENVKEQLQQQKLSEQFQQWLLETQENATINYFINQNQQ